ncbi:nitrate/nitrite transporter [Methylacidiphilum caldifontis]|uniref:MFS transporter n=1 Tax=Methylacidiphilum caldifontis TaxID=2795386 RepID=A0A4Y8PH79_9BACT|nr:MFS transporter [Methylacidiphilum caldifontis]TFE71788.1 MFS transporter [Methylacidiphilum caldifontis]
MKKRLLIFLHNKAILTLCCSFLYFDISFAIWVILGAVGTFISTEIQLSPVQKGLVVALPILSGSLLRIFFGIAESALGGKKTALIAMGLTAIPLLWGGLFAHSLKEIYCIGLLLGIAGASFAVALPMASRWFPPKNQGLVLGLAGSGNSGTLLCTFFGPLIAQAYGWHAVFIFFLILLTIVFFIFSSLAQDAPANHREKFNIQAILLALRHKRAWLFALLYSLSFGGFVGFSNYLGFFFVDDYKLEKVDAGKIQTLLIASGSLLRPFGGALADKLGGSKLLFVLFALATLLGSLLSFYFPFLIEITLLFFLMGCMGLANGAVFQLVGTQLANQIGTISGVVGAAGGMGGFFLPILFGKIKEHSGSCATGFGLFSSLLFLGGCLTLCLVFSERKKKILRIEVTDSTKNFPFSLPFLLSSQDEGTEKKEK